MEKLIAKYAEYAIYEAGRESIEALSKFIVEENYRHHCLPQIEFPSSAKTDAREVSDEEERLYTDSTKIYLARIIRDTSSVR